MKKNRDADALAARLAAAANQPPVLLAFPRPMQPEPEVLPPVEAAPAEPEAEAGQPAGEARRKKARKTRPDRPAAAEPDEDTVAMSLRPRREVLRRYVLAASERTRDAGRVISAQQIMLEVLERGP